MLVGILPIFAQLEQNLFWRKRTAPRVTRRL